MLQENGIRRHDVTWSTIREHTAVQDMLTHAQVACMHGTCLRHCTCLGHLEAAAELWAGPNATGRISMRPESPSTTHKHLKEELQRQFAANETQITSNRHTRHQLSTRHHA